MRKEKPKILYTKYMEEHKEEMEKQKLQEELHTDAIVVKKVSAGGKIVQLTVDILGKTVKVLFVAVILLLLSLAVTVLINEPLRNGVMEYLGLV